MPLLPLLWIQPRLAITPISARAFIGSRAMPHYGDNQGRKPRFSRRYNFEHLPPSSFDVGATPSGILSSFWRLAEKTETLKRGH
ncbi:hypothetical protein NL676_034696 [Syzygium grande]|nr:hypothetical protein NL676_034696 [Syzygium grande]